MPKKCEQCGFFHPENELTECPECGQELKFTMFAPGYQTKEQKAQDESHRAEAWDEKRVPSEKLELSIGVRMSQIGGGIVLYFVISRVLLKIFLSFFFGMEADMPEEQLAIAALMFILVFHVVGALVGGAVAGAYSINWVPQGIGVGLGIFILPLIFYFLFGQVDREDLVLFLTIIGITTAVSVLGAYIGHVLARPSRFIIS